MRFQVGDIVQIKSGEYITTGPPSFHRFMKNAQEIKIRFVIDYIYVNRFNQVRFEHCMYEFKEEDLRLRERP